MRLKDKLQSIPTNAITSVMPGGNYGDTLLYWGANKLIESLDIKVETLTKESFLSTRKRSNEIIYIHGGGIFNSWSSDSAFRILEKAVGLGATEIIIGPVSCSTEKEFLDRQFSECLESLSSNQRLTIYCREEPSFQIIKKLNALKSASVYKDKDTALNLTKDDISSQFGPDKAKYELLAYRQDKESPSYVPRRQAWPVLVDPPEYSDSFEQWVRIHLYAKRIVTNRTHSAILGSILNKPTALFEGRYHKNHSVWLESLKKRNVDWLSQEDAKAIAKPAFPLNLIPRSLLGSWKVTRLSQKLQGVPQT